MALSVPRDFRAGVRASLPMLLGVVPFAMVTGVAAVDVGLSVAAAMGYSVVVFAGASQLAAYELLGANAPVAVVVATACVINLRLTMYSASIAPYFRRFRARWRVPMSYLLTDMGYARAVEEYRESDVDERWFYLGVSLAVWVCWQAGTLVGALVGRGVPDSWGLGFAVPLVFLAMLVSSIRNRPTLAAGVVAAVAAVVGAGLPFDLGLLGGAVCGLVAGLVTEEVLA